MAKKSSIEKEKRREQLVKLKWAKRQELRAKAADLNATEEARQEARTALNKMPRNSCKVRLRSRCQITGRARGVLRKFRVSRLTFREMASFGLVPGVFKASW
jgi:small subunit ribosomal protein S14